MLERRHARRGYRSLRADRSMCRAARRAACLAAPCALEELEGRTLFATVPTGFTESLVVNGLSSPTAFAFAPDGRIFICEQGGQVRIVEDGELEDAPLLTVPTDFTAERGLLGLALDPNFTTDHYLYVFYTAKTPNAHNRISRFTVNPADDDSVLPGSEQVLLDLPDVGGAIWHMGGAMHFGPDGKLYIAVGDQLVDSSAGSLDTPTGKILRINADGSIPTDNPFYNQTIGINRAIYQLGLRNPFTTAIDPVSGALYVDDVGGSAFEEIDSGGPGANFGWPVTEGPSNVAGLTNPIYAYSHDIGQCIVGGAFYEPSTSVDQFPASYDGKYFFGDFASGWLKTYDPATKQVASFATGLNFPTGIEMSPDGELWYISRGEGTGGSAVGAGQLHVIEYSANQVPRITSQPQSVTVPVGRPATFTVGAGGTSPLQYQWQRNGANIAGAISTTYTVASPALTDNGALYRCVVTNTLGNITSQAAALIVTTDKAPVPVIVTPIGGTTYTAGQTFTFSGSATDAEDGTLPASAYSWSVVLHHEEHTHPFLGPIDGVTSGSFTIPTIGETSPVVWYEISLTVTDSAGISTTVYRELTPVEATATIITQPAGIPITLDSQPQTANPLVALGVAGMSRTLEVPDYYNVGGTTYEFQGWSDGGAISHTISFPSSDRAYTAVYRKRTVTYVSDLPYAGMPTNGYGPVERDMSPGENLAGDGTTITLNGKTYAKGLGVQANSEVDFDLSGQYDRFLADVGIDDEVGTGGSAVFQVWADGEKVFDSGLLAGPSDTVPIDVDVSGKLRLKLIVLNGGDDGTFDHADWADARLVVPTTPPAPAPPVVFASDLPFIGTPINAWGPVERDESNGDNGAADGKAITLNGITYAKGFGTNAGSEIDLNLGGKYSIFESDIGVDDEVGTGGSVVFQVWGDGQMLFQSGTMYGDTPTASVDLFVTGVETLKLIVTDSGDNNYNDHADWANARLTQTPAVSPPPPPVTTTTFVSDLPFLGTPTNGWGPVERDKSNGEDAAGDGGTLTLDGKTYAKGLGVHANSEVDYDLSGGAYTRFQSDIGVDDEESAGSVDFQVWGDGVKLFDSGMLYDDSPTQSIDLSVAGVTTLKLIVADGGDNNYNDHADWAGARFIEAGAILPPAVSVADVNGVLEGSSGVKNLVFTINRSYATDASTVAYTTADGTATTAGGDYQAVSGVLNFAAGELTKLVSVPVFGDTLIENDETFTLNLSNPTNATLSNVKATGTIINDDFPSFSVGGGSVTEGNAGIANLAFTVTRTDGTLASLVAFTTADGTATAASGDYVPFNGTLQFGPGELTKTVLVQVNGDAQVEPNETVLLKLSTPSNATIAVASATGTILNDDVQSFSIADASVKEGNSGAASMVFTVTRSDGSAASTVKWATSNGTATAGTDYTAGSGTLSFAVGQLSQTITVKVTGDTVTEANETLLLTLSKPSIGTLVRAQATGTIIDDDPLPTLSIGNVSKLEGNSGTQTYTFTITRSSGTGVSTVAWATADGTATVADADFLTSNGTLSFAAGVTSKTVTVTVKGDTKVESDEAFYVNLSNPTNATLAIAKGTGVIVNDDITPILKEAETAGTLHNVTVATKYTGYTGSGYVTFANPAAAGDYLLWSPTLPISGARTLTFRYANGGTAAASLNLTVNGVIVQSALSFASTTAWTKWKTVTVTVALTAGANTIRLISPGGTASPIIDSLTIS